MARIVITDDGSPSLYEETLQEGYHSVSGAMTESLEKFAKPLRSLIKKNHLKVLDTCFGLGYRSCAVAEVFKDHHLEITAVEKDPSLLSFMKQMVLPGEPQKIYSRFQQLAKDHLKISLPKLKLQLIHGDVRRVLPKLKKFDVVIHDPFSPKKVPELWTPQLFKKIFSHMNKQGVLVTYSCARSVRDALRAAGFTVIDGPTVGRRSPSTIAIKD